ncbi:MAG: putative metal-binding motif-containing protein, partial [Phycisphaerales bacterium]
EAFCSNIPVMEVLRPNNAVVSKSEGELTGVLAAIPRVDPHTLVIHVDGVDILEALAIDPATDFPGGPFDGTVDINGQLVEVTDLIVRSGAIGEPSGNTVSMKLGNLGCGGHVVAVHGEKRRGSLPKTVSSQCHRDDIQASGTSMVFGIEISSPLPGEVITDASGGVPSSINVSGEVCHGREIASLKINGLEVDTDFGQSVVAGDREDSATTVLVPFSVDVPVADIRQILETGEDPVGTFDPGSNRLIAQATDVERNSEFESLFFAAGPVIPVPEPETLYAMVAEAADEEITAEVERAFTMVLSTAGINKFFKEICDDIGPRIKHKVECRLKEGTKFGPKPIPVACRPAVTATVKELKIDDSFTCDVSSFERTGPDEPGGVEVKIGLPNFKIKVDTYGICERWGWCLFIRCCLIRIVIEMTLEYEMKDVSLTFTITEDNILHGTRPAKPEPNPGQFAGAPVEISNTSRIGCLAKIAIDFLKLFGGDDDVDYIAKFKDRLGDPDFGQHFDGLKGDFREARRFRFDNDELAERKLRIEHELSEVKFTTDSLSVAAKATFRTLESDPEANDGPGSQKTDADLLEMPIPDEPNNVFSSDPAGDVVVAISDDFFNQLFASLVKAGGLNTGYDLAERTVLDMLPDFVEDCDRPFCVGFRGEDCAEKFRLSRRKRERCQEVKDRNLRPTTRVILHARVDTPTLRIYGGDEGPPAGGSGVPVNIRYESISLAVIADRDPEPGLQSSLSEMSPCFGGGFTANTECTLWEACLTASIDVTMKRVPVPKPDGRRKSQIRFEEFSFDTSLTKGSICGGSAAEQVNPDEDPEQDRLIDRIRQFAEDEGLLDDLRGRLEINTPELESSGLDFGDVVDFEDDPGINIISIGNSGRDFRDYIGVTGNLSRRDREPRPMVCCYGDADGDNFGTDEEECCPDDDEEECRNIDCDDTDPDVYPGAPEYCDNRIDDNCNGEIDEDDCCTDNDGDGYGSGRECPGRDCDDDDATINPAAPERCNNGVDDNCNRRTDPLERCCIDNDSDGYGQEEPGGHGLRDVCWGYDCDDTDPTIRPGVPERCGNNIDDNCNFLAEPFEWCCIDGDRDNYGVGFGCWGLDCNDADADVNPGVWELCGNNVDDNCDGQIDEGC